MCPQANTCSMFTRSLAILASLAASFGTAIAAPKIDVRLDPALGDADRSGRLVVFLVGQSSGLDAQTRPIDGPFWASEQPLFGINLKGLKPSEAVTIGDSADGYPFKPGELKPGRYRAQAGLISRRENSDWKRVAGNLFSDEADLVVNSEGKGSVTLTLAHRTEAPKRLPVPGVEWFEAPSALLSGFRKEPVVLRAGVVLPLEYDPTRKYAAIYAVPGFGGDDRAAEYAARERAESTGAARELAKRTFLIVLDPEGPNGHTLFADSANNGPCARALIEEMIPALEKRYPLVPDPKGRMLKGHSSGGWSSLWLALMHPATFGATWSTSPDPVDFRKFQTVNIYEDKNFYSGGATDRPSFRELDRGTGKPRVVMTIRREARQEDVLGPGNTSGQQWDSWFAAFGPRDANGNPAALFDPVTGEIDRSVADAYRTFDIGSLVRSDPRRFLPLLRANVHLLVGDADSFYLNEAVALLQSDVARLQAEIPAGDTARRTEGYIRIVPGLDHSTILRSAQARAAPTEMLEFLDAELPAR